MKRFEKSTRPSSRPSGGINKSLTKDVTILPKAAPMTMPTARSMTLPRSANSRNSFHIAHRSLFSAGGKHALQNRHRVAGTAFRGRGRGDALVKRGHAPIDLAGRRAVAENS